MIIAVAGLMGSGKTTLVESLHQRLGWSFIPEALETGSFVRDILTDPGRWAFEAQVAFLSTKVDALLSLLPDGGPVVLDRSLAEDIEVFAESFIQSGAMDQRSAATYRVLSRILEDTVPEPVLTIYCSVPVDTAWQRVKQRARSDSHLPSAEWIHALGDLYCGYLRRQPHGRLLVLDTARHDIRQEHVAERVSLDVAAFVRGQSTRPPRVLRPLEESDLARLSPT